MLHRFALVLLVSASPSCEAIREAREAGQRVVERCGPGVTEERDRPLTDAKIAATLKMMDASIAAKSRPKQDGKVDEVIIGEMEAGGLGCGEQLAVLAKVRGAIDRLRERRGLPPLPHGSRHGGALLRSDAAEALTDADLALVDARFDEVDATVQRYVAAHPPD
jgi:hypothetical protein